MVVVLLLPPPSGRFYITTTRPSFVMLPFFNWTTALQTLHAPLCCVYRFRLRFS
ncbi:Uncharacterized protein APZ42_021317 [Daphnia magna]|uniref:Uncharacterized protein n=1 Tax=Daphnia magna TaxID=35525 RepID=A0A162CAP0_9CRUS|nr:Uncharacterized protein APZ42_021317 [Daphnia magna]